MKAKLKSTLLPLLTALIWGTAFVAQDVAAGHVPPMTFNMLRFFIAVLFLLPVKLIIGAVKRRKRPKEPVSPEGKRAGLRTLLIAGLLCGLALGVASFLQQAGMEAGTDSGKSGFITAMYVVLVPIGGLILGKRLPRIFWAGLALAVIGLYLLCISGKLTFTVGDLLTLLCAVAFTVQILLIDRFAKSLDPVLFCIAEFITAGVFSAAGMLLFEKPDWSEVVRYALPVLYVAIFSCGIAYLLQIVAQRDGNPAVVSLLFSMESVFSVIGGAVLLHQRMTVREYLGCALILAAVIIAQIPERKKNR
ncbi:MAG: DMT family transporter [Clostridia bacterium]|nr:DMT family transporter [Clostridia bacterium]